MARPRYTRLAGARARRLRRGLTISEARLWAEIKSGGAGARFRRQVPIGIWIADFACLDPKLVIEVDDSSHEWRSDEESRTRYLEACGFTVLRYTNRDIATDADGVVEGIKLAVEVLGGR